MTHPDIMIETDGDYDDNNDALKEQDIVDGSNHLCLVVVAPFPSLCHWWLSYWLLSMCYCKCVTVLKPSYFVIHIVRLGVKINCNKK